MRLIPYVILGQIESYPRRSSLIAPFQPELIEEVQKYIPKAFQVQLTYQYVEVRIESKKIGNLTRYEKITNNKTKYDNDGDLIELSIMEILLKVYQTINPILMVISMVGYFILMIQFFRKKYHFQNYKQIFVLNGLLCMYCTRVITVGYVAATEYTSAVNKCQYLASSYPVQSLFSILAIIFVIQGIQTQYHNKKQEREEESI